MSDLAKMRLDLAAKTMQAIRSNDKSMEAAFRMAKTEGTTLHEVIATWAVLQADAIINKLRS